MTDRYAVVGHPIAQTKSPRIHAAFAHQTGEDLVYDAILAPLDGFGATVAAFRAPGGRAITERNFPRPPLTAWWPQTYTLFDIRTCVR